MRSFSLLFHSVPLCLRGKTCFRLPHFTIRLYLVYVRWIIGDIHGMARALEGLLNAIDKRDGDAKLFFVGDYVNRGHDSKGVIERCLALPKGKARFVRGNHDDIFDQVLHGQSYAPNASEGDPLVAFRWFMQYGLDATLESYGAKSLPELKEKIPEAHRAFIRALEPVIEQPEFFVAHGNWPADDADARMSELVQNEPQRRRALLWNRFITDEIVREKAWNRVGYFGHTPVEIYPELLRDPRVLVPIQSWKIRLVDTGCALQPYGRLTAYCHESNAFVQVDRQGRVIEEADA